jgi:hypothetical protein
MIYGCIREAVLTSGAISYSRPNTLIFCMPPDRLRRESRETDEFTKRR